MTTLVKVPSVKIGTDAECSAQFLKLFKDAEDASKRIVSFGLFAWNLKLCLLKRGQFMNWVQVHCPTLKHRSVNGHMDLARSAMEACGIKVLKKALDSNSQHVANLPLWELPLLPEAKVPDAQKPLHKKLCDLIEGKSARQLFAEFKQSDDDEENPKPKRGRLKGHGGATAAQRAAAAEKEEASRINDLELEAEQIAKALDLNCDLNGYAKIEPKIFEQLRAAVNHASAWMNSVHKSRSKRQAGVQP